MQGTTISSSTDDVPVKANQVSHEPHKVQAENSTEVTIPNVCTASDEWVTEPTAIARGTVAACVPFAEGALSSATRPAV